MPITSDDNDLLFWLGSMESELPIALPPAQTHNSSTLLEQTRQLLQIMRDNAEGSCDFNKAIEILGVRERQRLYDVYHVLLGAGIIEESKDDKTVLFKLKPIAPALPPVVKLDKEIQTCKTRMCAFINLSLDNKVTTINCFHCDEEFPIWNWPKFSAHVKETHLGWDLEFLEMNEPKITTESLSNEGNTRPANESKKVKDPSVKECKANTPNTQKLGTQKLVSITKNRVHPAASRAQATMTVQAHKLVLPSKDQITAKSKNNLIGYVTNNHVKPELVVQSVDDLIELVLDDAEDSIDRNSYSVTKDSALASPSMTPAYVVPAFVPPSYVSAFASSAISSAPSIAPTFLGSAKHVMPAAIDTIEFVSSGKLDEDELSITYQEYSEDDAPPSEPIIPADDSADVADVATINVEDMDFDPLSDVESLESLKFEFETKPLVRFRPTQIWDNVKSAAVAAVERPNVFVTQANAKPIAPCENGEQNDSKAKDETKQAAETISQIFLERTDPEVVMDFLDLFKMRSALWSCSHESMKRYNVAVAEITALLNARWNLSFTPTSMALSLNCVRDWYCNVVYNRSKYGNPENYQHKFAAYFEKCAEFLPRNGRGLPCKECSLRLHNEISLQLHRYKKHGLGNLPYICSHCDARFGDTCSLEQHENSHEKSQFQPHKKCGRCGEVFESDDLLQQHAKTHSDKRSCKCDICNKEFTTISICQQHRVKHFPPKFKCELCPQSYTTRVRLTYHMKRHRQEFDFVCEYCGKMFIRKRSLDVHQKGIHRLEIICNICNKNCSNETALRFHKMAHHFVYEGTVEDLEQITVAGFKKGRYVRDVTGTYFYECDACNNSYKTKNALHEHRDKIHGIKRIKHPNFKSGSKILWAKRRAQKAQAAAAKVNVM